MMRQLGRRIPKRHLFDRRTMRYNGLCVVREMQDIYTRRTMTIARFGSLPDADGGHVLYDARLVWFEPETQNFMLTGFERREMQGGEVEFAQSWLVYLDKGPPEQDYGEDLTPEAIKAMSERELKRFCSQR